MSRSSSSASLRTPLKDTISASTVPNQGTTAGTTVKISDHKLLDDSDTDSFLWNSTTPSTFSDYSFPATASLSPVKATSHTATLADGAMNFATNGFFSSIIKWIKDKIFTPAAPPDQWNLITLFGSAATEHAMLAKNNGAGVHVGIYDDGIDKSVSALMTHYDASREVVIDGVRADAGLLQGGGQGVHGTATAGIVAADPTRTGGQVTGIANGAWLTDVNVFSGKASFGWGYLSAMRQMDQFDVTSHSYGNVYKWNLSDSSWSSYYAELSDNIAHAATAGRNGLGTVVVWSAGNDWRTDRRDVNTDATHADRHVIVVGAIGSDNDVSSYSTRGAAILTSAPSSGSKLAITTTDRTGSAGYSNSNITDTFGGTSASTPEVAAVVADMFTANGKLGARDVQNILALASHDNELPFFATWATFNMAYGWTVNHTNTFNGGGYHFSNDEGFGELNAHDAIREAAVWSYMNPVAQTFNNEVHLSATAAGKAVPATMWGTDFSFTVSGSEVVENADVTLNVSTANLNNLKVVLTSPNGTQSIILDSSLTNSSDFYRVANNGASITLASHAFLGEDAQGTWTMRVYDTFTSDSLRVNSATLDLYGSASAKSHVFHYTDEAQKMVINDFSRFTLHDTSGVGSWIDTAMMTGNESIDLHPGSFQSEGGIWFARIAGDTVINNVTLGDGVCTVRCNDNGDKVVAGAGTAWINGGWGNDTFIAGSGTETINSGGGSDKFVFDHRGFGSATITDFTKGLDQIDLRGLGLSFGNLGIADNGSTIWISNFDAEGDKIVLTNTHQQHLSASDFLFA